MPSERILSENLKSLIWSVPPPVTAAATAAVSATATAIAEEEVDHEPHLVSLQPPATATAALLSSTRSEVDYSHQEDPTHGTSSVFVATFNLVATIVGGGVLSVPFAFWKCGGALWGILWMILAAVATDQSCGMLCWSARPHNHFVRDNHEVLSSYGQVGKAAFGPLVEVAISALLFVFLVFVLIAYMVLVKDIWTPLILSLFKDKGSQDMDKQWGPIILLAIIAFMSPFLVQRSLHALRYNCYIGFASVSLLCLALCYHALITNTTAITLEAPMENNDGITDSDAISNSSSIPYIHAHVQRHQKQETTISFTTLTNVLWTRQFWFKPPQSIQDVVTAFPILMLSFLCHFNVNPIQKALIRPTPKRVSIVIHAAMAACAVLMTTFGVAGYAYVVGNNDTSIIVQGNILLNCREQYAVLGKRDVLLTVGRIGCGITIMLAMAIMMLPCRDSLLEVLDSIVYRRSPFQQISNSNDDHQQIDSNLGTNTETSASNGEANSSLLQQESNMSLEAAKKQSMSLHSNISNYSNKSYAQSSEETPLFDNTYSLRSNPQQPHEHQLLLPPKYSSIRQSTATSITMSNNTIMMGNTAEPPSLSDNTLIHYGTTFAIVLICYITAIKVPGVAIVWSLCGSCMAFGIAFVLPCAFYLKILKHYNQQMQLQPQLPYQYQQHLHCETQPPPKVHVGVAILDASKPTVATNIEVEAEQKSQPSPVLAWILLVVSIVAAVVCTTQTIQSMAP